MPQTHFFLWPDHVIGKRESRRIREEHNATVSKLVEQRDNMLESLRLVKEWMEDCMIDRQQAGTPSRIRYNTVCDSIAKATA